MKPFFSVIIPTLNEEKYLPKLLNDLLKQTKKDFEVIVVDGNSRDKTKEVTTKFNNILDIKFINHNKRNVASQRNFGASNVQGKYLVFLDADARIKASFLKKASKKIIKGKGLVFIPFLIPEKRFKEYQILFDLFNLMTEFSQNLNKRFSLGGSMIIEKDFFLLISGFNEKLFVAEDHELIQRIAKWGVRPKFLHNTKVTVCLRRIEKEGWLKSFYKYFLSTTHRLFIGEIKDRIYDYEMGGQLYDKKNLKKAKKITINFNQVKRLFNRFLKELEIES